MAKITNTMQKMRKSFNGRSPLNERDYVPGMTCN